MPNRDRFRCHFALERMVVIKVFIAVRVLGLRQGVSVKKYKMTAVRKY